MLMTEDVFVGFLPVAQERQMICAVGLTLGLGILTLKSLQEHNEENYE